MSTTILGSFSAHRPGTRQHPTAVAGSGFVVAHADDGACCSSPTRCRMTPTSRRYGASSARRQSRRPQRTRSAVPADIERPPDTTDAHEPALEGWFMRVMRSNMIGRK